jgi:hypothetical protein
MKIKTSELSGKALDWAVAKCRGATDEWRQYGPFFWDDVACIRVDGHDIDYCPSDMWMLGGPIVEQEKLNLTASVEGNWIANLSEDFEMLHIATGDTPLIAAMRCYVASKMGEYVEAPEA